MFWQIEEDVKDAIVYIDAGCTESFQLAGAFPLFLELGARSVCSLENMTSLDAVSLCRFWFHNVRFEDGKIVSFSLLPKCQYQD